MFRAFVFGSLILVLGAKEASCQSVVAIFEAEAMKRQKGIVAIDSGRAVVFDGPNSAPGYLTYGPYVKNLVGRMRANFIVKAIWKQGLAPSAWIATYDVYDATAKRVLVSGNISHRSLADYGFVAVTTPYFDVPKNHLMEFRVYHWGNASFSVDSTILTR